MLLYLVLVLGGSITREEHLSYKHLVGNVTFARLLVRILEPALDVVADHLRQRLPLALRPAGSIRYSIVLGVPGFQSSTVPMTAPVNLPLPPPISMFFHT